jgi:hypothetical protein
MQSSVIMKYLKSFLKYKTGYHFTSIENYKKIKKHGLIPYPLKMAQIITGFEYIPPGIFLYDHYQDPKSTAGIVMYHASFKLSTTIVFLAVDYKESETRSPDFRPHGFCDEHCLTGCHDLGLFKDQKPDEFTTEEAKSFWHKAAPFTIVFKRIPPRRIKLLKTYNLVELINA